METYCSTLFHKFQKWFSEVFGTPPFEYTCPGKMSILCLLSESVQFHSTLHSLNSFNANLVCPNWYRGDADASGDHSKAMVIGIIAKTTDI